MCLWIWMISKIERLYLFLKFINTRIDKTVFIALMPYLLYLPWSVPCFTFAILFFSFPFIVLCFSLQLCSGNEAVRVGIIAQWCTKKGCIDICWRQSYKRNLVLKIKDLIILEFLDGALPQLRYLQNLNWSKILLKKEFKIKLVFFKSKFLL